MIKYNPKIWFAQIFKITKGDTLRVLLPELIILAILTGGLTWLELTYLQDHGIMKDAIAVYSFIGFVLSLLLVFRTNTAYDRWWEGRKKWGLLVNDSRSLALKISTSSASNEDKNFFSKTIANYVYTLKWHLRYEKDKKEVDMTEEELKAFMAASHKPSYLSQLMYTRLQTLLKSNKITEAEYFTIDTNLNNFSNITGACERIRNTPMPYSYSLFLKKFIFIYVTTLPLGFVSTFGYGTILIACFIFYVLVSIELLAEEIEDPFGNDDNDLPLDELCAKIKDNVEGILTTETSEAAQS
ncbi:MAG: bestrophin family protein [Bacteroidia bacterium]|nr:bestrophin family protein [Bacteroidia bacterium]